MADQREQSRTTAKRVTMGDIARAAGCSQSTVSFVLNDNRTVSISDEMRARVIKIAREKGYNLPQVQLLNMSRAQQSGCRKIGFIIDSLSTSPEGVVAIRGVRNALQGSGVVLLISETGNDPELEPSVIGAHLQAGVEAIIYTCIFTRDIDLPDALVNCGVPVVLLNCTSDAANFPSVVPSEIAGGQHATQILLEAGHTRIGTIAGEEFMSASQDRLKGYRRALATADIPFDPKMVVFGDWSASAGYRGTKQLMEAKNRPTAIFCQNDRMAIGCFEYLKERGLRIPQDISVVGYDDEEISRHLSPMLTTVVLPHRDMGKWAVEKIFEDDSSQNNYFARTKLECILVERDSVAPPAS